MINDIKDSLKEYLEKQPYSAVCEVCGNPLVVDTTVDDDLDMILSVHPCEECIKNAKEELDL